MPIAYAAHGRGPAIVKAGHWLSHVEWDSRSPLWQHWLEGLGAGHRLVRYDPRGCGLSDRAPEEVGLDRFVGDLAAVVDAAGPERFAPLGACEGGATAIAYRGPDTSEPARDNRRSIGSTWHLVGTFPFPPVPTQTVALNYGATEENLAL